MNTFKDIFKKSFLENYSSESFTTNSLIVLLLITALISIFIFFFYKIITRKSFYSKNFNISLVGVSIITATIIITIQSSVVVSLGMVGALSIVRFRTAIKNPIDLMFLFWSISTGIVCGAGLPHYAIILAIVMVIVVTILSGIPTLKAPLLLIISASDTKLTKTILKTVKSNTSHYEIKAQNMTSDSLDMTIEVRTNKREELLSELLQLDNIKSASLISHDGEATF